MRRRPNPWVLLIAQYACTEKDKERALAESLQYLPGWHYATETRGEEKRRMDGMLMGRP